MIPIFYIENCCLTKHPFRNMVVGSPSFKFRLYGTARCVDSIQQKIPPKFPQECEHEHFVNPG